MDLDTFVIRTNIARYRRLLQTEMDETKRQFICHLLAEVEAAESLTRVITS